MDSTYRIVLNSKIHRATVTAVRQDYMGSITIDKNLLKQVGMGVHEQVHVLNITNGARIITYAIEGQEGDFEINGAAAHFFNVGDRIIVISYAHIVQSQLANHRPNILLMDDHNQVLK